MSPLDCWPYTTACNCQLVYKHFAFEARLSFCSFWSRPYLRVSLPSRLASLVIGRKCSRNVCEVCLLTRWFFWSCHESYLEAAMGKMVVVGACMLLWELSGTFNYLMGSTLFLASQPPSSASVDLPGVTAQGTSQFCIISWAMVAMTWQQAAAMNWMIKFVLKCK